MLFSHVINPFRAPAGSEHERAQEMTWAALRHALSEAKARDVSVELLAATLPKDVSAIEQPALALPPLARSVSDVAPLAKPVPFPLIADVLILAAEHGHGDFLVFTNMDICPQPYFYSALAEMVRGGECAFVIPRRTIDARFTKPSELPEMYREDGTPHEGFDCFVFPRAWASQLDLGTLCLGSPAFDLALILNLEALSKFRAKVLWHQFLTFHIGNDQAWKDGSEINGHNHAEALRVCARLEARCGPAPPRSKFVYAKTWLTHEPPPIAGKALRAWKTLEQKAVELRYRWLVRKFRRATKLSSW